MGKKRFFASHAKSSAALISLGIHAILIVVAISFVAVTVIQKEDQTFEAKPVSRPKMQLKKLQVPVNIKKKKTQKPKLRKRIVVKPKLNKTMPDIKMPEITGVKGGIGSGAGTGLGGGGGLGFSMPEINIFGVKGKGEKIFIILNASDWMMVDELGGIPAYELIKEELVKVLGGLSPTILFNIAVYFPDEAYVLFPSLVPASATNVEKVKEWITPLNTFDQATAKARYGPSTLGRGGQKIRGDLLAPPIKSIRYWARPTMLAMEQQADVVFALTESWGALLYTPPEGTAAAWPEAKRARYERDRAEAEKKYREDNKQRAGRGQPPRVFKNKFEMMRNYVPGIEFPPIAPRISYKADDMYKAMYNMYKKSEPKAAVTSGLRKKKNAFTFNVIQFIKKGDSSDGGSLKQLCKETRGEYRKISGLDEIKSASLSGSQE